MPRKLNSTERVIEQIKGAYNAKDAEIINPQYGDCVESNLAVIKEKEPEMYSAICLVVKHVAGTYSDKYAKGQDTIDTKKMLYNEKDGRPINIYQVCRYLQRYNTEGSAKSHLLKDLEKAVHYLLFEITRRIRLGQFDETEPKV